MSKPTVINVPTYQDDRGQVYCVLDHMLDKDIKRTYFVENHSKGMIRAWHGHRKADTYMHVVEGAVKLAAMNMDDHQDVFITTLTSKKPAFLYVPAGYYNGSMSLTDGTKILVFSTLTFNDVKKDDERAVWNINGSIWEVVKR